MSFSPAVDSTYISRATSLASVSDYTFSTVLTPTGGSGTFTPLESVPFSWDGVENALAETWQSAGVWIKTYIGVFIPKNSRDDVILEQCQSKILQDLQAQVPDYMQKIQEISGSEVLTSIEDREKELLGYASYLKRQGKEKAAEMITEAAFKSCLASILASSSPEQMKGSILTKIQRLKEIEEKNEAFEWDRVNEWLQETLKVGLPEDILCENWCERKIWESLRQKIPEHCRKIDEISKYSKNLASHAKNLLGYVQYLNREKKRQASEALAQINHLRSENKELEATALEKEATLKIESQERSLETLGEAVFRSCLSPILRSLPFEELKIVALSKLEELNGFQKEHMKFDPQQVSQDDVTKFLQKNFPRMRFRQEPEKIMRAINEFLEEKLFDSSQEIIIDKDPSFLVRVEMKTEGISLSCKIKGSRTWESEYVIPKLNKPVLIEGHF